MPAPTSVRFSGSLPLAALCGTLLLPASAGAIVAGAAHTTFDATIGGCYDSPNGVNCNHYDSKLSVYINGGPVKGGWHLSEGEYFFAVLTPGSQNGGFVDGAEGNLSDVYAGGTEGDFGGGDDVANRTFTVYDHEMAAADASLAAYPCTVAAGDTRTQQEALKNALDNANNNRTFVQCDPSYCPAPVF
jgi:hypothetical protein